MKLCKLCSKDISERHHSAKYCVECAIKKNLEDTYNRNCKDCKTRYCK
jgi:hypothetical protein